MRIDLTGRSALVTGASEGLGRAVAGALAAAGANVALLARRAGPLERAAAELRERAGATVLPLLCDITDAAQRDAAIAAALDRFGTVDILVNNAGSSRRGPLEEQTRDAVVDDYDLKILAPMALIQRVVPGMRTQRWGRVINVSAIVGKAPDGGSIPTSLSRAAGITMTKALSKELAPHNILVNALLVGKIKSGQWERRHAASGPAQSYDDFLAPVARTVPLGRMGEAEEFANVALFLASDLASYVTGTAINVDGGLCPVP
jgi:NAD(P)-dependent dehydrogenase (short-subunit alcohol dehydrogenase family)